MTVYDSVNKDKHIRIYKLLHELGFSPVTPFVAVMSIVFFQDVVNLNSFLFRDAFLKLKKKLPTLR